MVEKLNVERKAASRYLKKMEAIGILISQKIGWENTYLFIFDSKDECIFAIEFHYSSSIKVFMENVLLEIKYFVEELEEKSPSI